MTKHALRTAFVTVAALMLVFAQVVTASGQSDDEPGATDVGVTADTIRIGIVVDIDNAFVPGIFRGASDAVRGAAKYINANGGIAGRKLVVDVYDSKLNANEARNGFISACEKDFALVGTTALFVSNFDDVVNCKDKEGKTTGLPDVAGLVTSLTEACSSVTYSPNAPQILCDTFGQDPMTFQGTMGAFKYVERQLDGDAHGALLTSNDTPDAKRSGQANMLLVKKAGVTADTEVSLSSRDPQSAFTPIVQQMKTDNSNFSYLTMSVNSAIQLRQEAELQGIPADDVTWLCPTTCYDHEAMSKVGSVMDGELINLNFLPFEEAGSNKMLARFLKYTGRDKADPFGVLGWAAAMLFQKAMTDVVEEHGVNGVTRANLFTALKNTHSFNAGGLIGTADVANKISTPCYLLVKWENSKYTRVTPTKKGTFDCKASNYTTVEASPTG